MKTIKIAHSVRPYHCPRCKALYFSEVDCECELESGKIFRRSKMGVRK